VQLLERVLLEHLDEGKAEEEDDSREERGDGSLR